MRRNDILQTTNIDNNPDGHCSGNAGGSWACSRIRRFYVYGTGNRTETPSIKTAGKSI